MNNQVMRYGQKSDTTGHTYTGAIRIWNNNANNMIQFVIGVLVEPILVSIFSSMSGATGGSVGIGPNSVSYSWGSNASSVPLESRIATLPYFTGQLVTGYNYIAALETGIASLTLNNFYLWAAITG
jgi:hypothetical protein